MKYTRIAIILIVTLMFSLGASLSASAADYKALDMKGFNDLIEQNSGKPSFILFWTTWCPSCKHELPEMEEFKASHGDRVSVFSVALDEDSEALDAYFKAKKLDLPVYHGEESLARRFKIEAIPTLVILDGNGKMVFNQAGIFPHSMLEKMAAGLLK